MILSNNYFLLTLVVFIICIIHVESSCPVGYDQVNSKCITITPQRFTHHKALLTCKEKNGHLVFVQNAIDNTAIVNYASNITSPMWIGAICKVNKQPKECTWDDGSTLDYSNFLPGYPVTNIGTCVYIDSPNQPLKGRWISATCELDEYHAICEAN
ncbi:hypothetical protein GCK72_017707 [Caenorhabditis remanei]|uniref:C-type lectin domain-containing protein n=1 Tax=Caenorhabditis remanei TaxID=31234 RepID=A0A6A5G8Y8_CAERE|nr:hypothetical protein GCK72_017707 [Caenorhabditis remanei]KAF1751153.1 hypothetical protein GCK72_017707 [Caenorhabditis remanei]